MVMACFQMIGKVGSSRERQNRRAHSSRTMDEKPFGPGSLQTLRDRHDWWIFLELAHGKERGRMKEEEKHRWSKLGQNRNINEQRIEARIFPRGRLQRN